MPSLSCQNRWSKWLNFLLCFTSLLSVILSPCLSESWSFIVLIASHHHFKNHWYTFNQLNKRAIKLDLICRLFPIQQKAGRSLPASDWSKQFCLQRLDIGCHPAHHRNPRHFSWVQTERRFWFTRRCSEGFRRQVPSYFQIYHATMQPMIFFPFLFKN